jgi:acyl-CoA thioester hydrolase
MSEQKPISAAARIQVRFNECDPLGIVWHGNYVKYFEDGREAFSEKFGLDYWKIYMDGFSTPVVHMEHNFKRTLKYKDVAIVETTLRKTPAAKIIFDYKIMNDATGELVCTGTTTQVFVANGNMQLSLVVPNIYSEWKKKIGV